MGVLRVYLYKGVIGGEDVLGIFGVFCVLVVKTINCHCKWFFSRRSDGTGNIVTAIHLINKDVASIGSFALFRLTIDVNVCASAHISHTGTTKHTVDITTLYGYRSLSAYISLVTATVNVTANLLPVGGQNEE